METYRAWHMGFTIFAISLHVVVTAYVLEERHVNLPSVKRELEPGH